VSYCARIVARGLSRSGGFLDIRRQVMSRFATAVCNQRWLTPVPSNSRGVLS
jgi:hypothetical protein